jgi:uncharacterized protein (DUF983 family)
MSGRSRSGDGGAGRKVAAAAHGRGAVDDGVQRAVPAIVVVIIITTTVVIPTLWLSLLLRHPWIVVTVAIAACPRLLLSGLRLLR